MSSNLSILVPTYNRPKELERLLTFLGGSGNQYAVKVLDGSSQAIKERNAVTISRFRFAEHRQFDSALHLGLRCAAGVAAVDTEYVVFCADDDFVFPAALADCTQFLDRNADYSVVLGRVLVLNYLKNKRFFRNGVFFEDHLGTVGYMAHDRFLQRALYYFAFTSLGSTPLFYGVKRTALARESFNLVTKEMKYSGMELLLNAFALVRGKIAVLDTPFGLRDYSSETTRDPEREDPVTYLSAHDLEMVRSVLITELGRTEPASDETIRTITDLFITHAPPRGWVPPRNPSGEPAWVRRMKLAISIIGSILAPAGTASRHGISADTMRALMHAHTIFVRSAEN